MTEANVNANYNITNTALLQGGLGNQLFQIFNLISYSLTYKQKFHLQNLKYTLGITKRKTYWNDFLINLKSYLVDIKKTKIRYNEKNFNYNKINNMLNNVEFLGYYQSYKYFCKNYDKIIDILKLNTIKNKILSQSKINFKNTISLHFRIGDYINLQEHHPILKIDYYINSINTILNKTKQQEWTIIFYNEKKDNECVSKYIDTLKNKFKSINFIKSSNEMSDWEQMIEMSFLYS